MKRLPNTRQKKSWHKKRTQDGMPFSLNAWSNASTVQRVRCLMVLFNWSLSDLAYHAGLTKQAWSKAMRREDWTASQLVRVASAFGVSPGDLIRFPSPDECADDPDLWAKGEDL